MMLTCAAKDSCLMVDVEGFLVMFLSRRLPVLSTGCRIDLAISDVAGFRGVWYPRRVMRIAVVLILSVDVGILSSLSHQRN